MSLVLFLMAALNLSPAQAQTQVPAKMNFWKTQRKGANCFNLRPELAWFQAAKAQRLGWVRLAYDKWQGQERDFLLGNADQFQHLQPQDLAQLKRVLDMAQQAGVKVVISPLSLPGARWRQNNNDQADLRLWQDKAYWQQAALFWQELALALKDHPAVVGYNLINEPTPEMGTGLPEQGPAQRYLDWYARYRGSSHDLPAFYQTLITAIRQVDPETPILLDAGWYAQPAAFVHWQRLSDPYLLYAFHMYEPYAFTNLANFKAGQPYRYPGMIPLEKEPINWNAAALKRHLMPFLDWARRQKLAPHQIVASEFGCYRRNPGCAQYLQDLIQLWNQERFHWAFYSFREDEWDGYDYEVGTGPLPASYWEALDRGEHPSPPRKANPLFEVLAKEFRAPQRGPTKKNI